LQTSAETGCVGEPRMYKKDNRFAVPESDAKIWRYMTLERLYELLKTGCLYFCEINALRTADPYEGSYYACKLLSQVDAQKAERFAKRAKSCGPAFAVNCWHVNESECMAMWRIYAKEDKGVAIQSTLGRMVESIQGVADNIYIGPITYTDTPVPHPTGAEGDLFMTCMTKRKCFEFERELRAFVWESRQLARTDNGSALVPVDLSKLIQCIYTSPTSRTMVEIVKSLVKEMQPDVRVVASTILSEPPY
jgi:hypothetical protein